MDPQSHEQLVEQSRQGSREAFSALVRRHQVAVYSICYRTVGDPLEAEDLAQEAFLRTYRALGTFRRAALAGHLEGCDVCRARLAAAQRLEGLLRAGITPVEAPATLASRVAGSLALALERPRRSLWSRLAGRRVLSSALAGLAAALALALVSYAVAPVAVMALAQRVLFFVPGLGIKPVGDSTLVATDPVSVQNGTLTFTVEALLSDGKQTTVKFALKGLPGDKAILERLDPDARKPVLRDGEGHQYVLQASFSSVGGRSEETILSGEMRFPPLPAGLQSVDLVVPLDYLVPSAVVPGTDHIEMVARIVLAAADQSGLPAATAGSTSTSGFPRPGMAVCWLPSTPSAPAAAPACGAPARMAASK